jgi:hypothetical protein
MKRIYPFLVFCFAVTFILITAALMAWWDGIKLRTTTSKKEINEAVTAEINRIIESECNGYRGRFYWKIRVIHAHLRKSMGDYQFMLYLQKMERLYPKPKYGSPGRITTTENIKLIFSKNNRGVEWVSAQAGDKNTMVLVHPSKPVYDGPRIKKTFIDEAGQWPATLPGDFIGSIDPANKENPVSISFYKGGEVIEVVTCRNYEKVDDEMRRVAEYFKFLNSPIW